MPIFDEPRKAVPFRTSVRASAAIELEWVLHSAMREDFRADHPALRALYDVERPDLLAAVAAMWSDTAISSEEASAHGGFTELVLVAHQGDLLFGEDAPALLDALPDLCASVPTTVERWPLLAETDEDRRIALHRLTRLRRSSEVQKRYVDLVRNVWDAASVWWARDGRGAVAETVEEKAAMISRGAGWRDLTRGAWDFGDAAGRVIAALPPDGEIVVTPAYFAHRGLLYDLPGYVVLGIRAEEPGHAARERNEELSRRLRALSDPTRLAIVDSLRSRPLTITELSQRFGLAQPTVSTHVKVLRDAGVVAEVREQGRRNLVVRRDAAAVLVDDLSRVLAVDPAPQSAPPDG
ncbi:MAG TPA: metalloregulator ArsR/SmtB family transcription factor [Acidimicrobiales bacterium]|nr:metalloregulator ArsR/SmtB family transcription factor [Acidimicrobiales bacterium]